ncbi:MAG: 5,10-methylenetetrahydrofolate reductase [Propionibacteriales bacterium]|nr:5,10-methylenetetrahydrofolate reductase [Propionibacteriales bacterium]
MRNSSRRAGLRAALESPRYEIIPAAKVEAAVFELPRDVTITVTASPTKGLDATLECAERVAGQGFRTVPHVSARLVVDYAHLSEIAARLAAAGIREVFVPAGDADPPAGRYDGSHKFLLDLARLGSPFAEVGITGYPESHPAIADDVTVQAMWDKREHATYVVSNLCFDPAVLRRWVDRTRARGITLPIQMGLAGPVERTKLLAMATKVGVGESTRFLSKHGSRFARIAMPGGYSPERMLNRTKDLLNDPVAHVVGLHIFTFNQVAETERWRQQMLGRVAGVGAAS